MRVALLAAWAGGHGSRWANGLAERGCEVHLITMHPGTEPLAPGVTPHRLPIPAPAGYYLNSVSLKQLLRRIRPDLLHTHYASGYGTLGRRCGFHPALLSVWGSDVYIFPDQSDRNRRTLLQNLAAADQICSTSQAMADRVRALWPQAPPLHITPFGIDTRRFVPRTGPATCGDEITVGTIKTLKPVYGVDLLIEAFAKAVQISSKQAADRLRLRIVGGGPDRATLEALALQQNVAPVTQFDGQVPHDEVVTRMHQLDIYVALSRSESFGVAVLEASACGLPVVVSNVGGLPEVVRDGETGVVCAAEDVDAAAAAIAGLAADPERRAAMGAAGRRWVCDAYSWPASVDKMMAVYAGMTAGAQA
ncbi:MAG: glycosyltransferase [Armatimonadetes bacterium]|nr:glycosyltransferase [Armatimonadota bacterium]MDE2207789.1 glycosyltransferase [Armatimonadota bacterium]